MSLRLATTNLIGHDTSGSQIRQLPFVKALIFDLKSTKNDISVESYGRIVLNETKSLKYMKKTPQPSNYSEFQDFEVCLKSKLNLQPCFFA